jgi:ATP-dependent Clp protease ATP-binding subunit ClpC
MFEKYTEGARRAIVVARHEADRRGHKEIEPAHLLMGILQQGEITPLFGSDVSKLESIRSRIAQCLPVERQPLPDKTDIPMTHATKRILAYAAEESDMMHHTAITSAHLLLGIHWESRGRQTRILNLFTQPPLPESAILIEYGADRDTLRARVAESTRPG